MIETVFVGSRSKVARVVSANSVGCDETEVVKSPAILTFVNEALAVKVCFTVQVMSPLAADPAVYVPAALAKPSLLYSFGIDVSV